MYGEDGVSVGYFMYTGGVFGWYRVRVAIESLMVSCDERRRGLP